MMEYFYAHHTQLLTALLEHVELSATALAIAMVLAFPIGYFLARSPRASEVILSVFGVLYSIPSMALLVLLVPVFGLGNMAAIIVLVVYAQFVLIRSVILAFRSIDASVLEAAKGIGLNAFQRLLRVELPIVLPAVIGGLRVAASSVISIASIAAWINAGGLGNILFEGIYQNKTEQLFWGTLLISGLALTVELALQDIETQARQESLGQIPVSEGALSL